MNALTKILRKTNVPFCQQRRILHPIRNQYRTNFTNIMNRKNQNIGSKLSVSQKRQKMYTIIGATNTDKKDKTRKKYDGKNKEKVQKDDKNKKKRKDTEKEEKTENKKKENSAKDTTQKNEKTVEKDKTKKEEKSEKTEDKKQKQTKATKEETKEDAPQKNEKIVEKTEEGKKDESSPQSVPHRARGLSTPVSIPVKQLLQQLSDNDSKKEEETKKDAPQKNEKIVKKTETKKKEKTETGKKDESSPQSVPHRARGLSTPVSIPVKKLVQQMTDYDSPKKAKETKKDAPQKNEKIAEKTETKKKEKTETGKKDESSPPSVPHRVRGLSTPVSIPVKQLLKKMPDNDSKKEEETKKDAPQKNNKIVEKTKTKKKEKTETGEKDESSPPFVPHRVRGLSTPVSIPVKQLLQQLHDKKHKLKIENQILKQENVIIN